jgi:hypothetical protein
VRIQPQSHRRSELHAESPEDNRQNAPPLPQDFTRNVCVPSDALTLVLIDVAGLNTVSDPESIEYAMLTVDCDRHVDDDACTTNGELTTAPLAGADTETSAATAGRLKRAAATSAIAQEGKRTTEPNDFKTFSFRTRQNTGRRRLRACGMGRFLPGTPSNRCDTIRASWELLNGNREQRVRVMGVLDDRIHLWNLPPKVSDYVSQEMAPGNAKVL